MPLHVLALGLYTFGLVLALLELVGKCETVTVLPTELVHIHVYLYIYMYIYRYIYIYIYTYMYIYGP